MPSSKLPPTGSWSPTGTISSGSAWTRCAPSVFSNASGRAARLRGAPGIDDRGEPDVLARPPDAGHGRDRAARRLVGSPAAGSGSGRHLPDSLLDPRERSRLVG